MTEKKTMKPKCVAILAADHAWMEENGKVGISGIFENMLVRKLPGNINPFWIYLRIVDLPKGHFKLEIKVGTGSSDIIGMESEFDVNKENVSLSRAFKVPIFKYESGEFIICSVYMNSVKLNELSIKLIIK